MISDSQILDLAEHATSPEWPDWYTDDDALRRFAHTVYAQALLDAAAVCRAMARALDHGGHEYIRYSQLDIAAGQISALAKET